MATPLEEFLRDRKQYREYFGYRVGKEFHGRVYKRKHFAIGVDRPHKQRRKRKCQMKKI